MTRFEGHVDSSDGLRLRYEVEGSRIEGPDEAPLLLCASGGPGRASEYLGELGGLSATRRVVRLDTRGTGRSQAPEDPSGYAPERLIDDLDRVRDHLGVGAIDVLGHSAGGPIALGYAAVHPEHVRRLVLVTTFLPVPDDAYEDERAQIDAERTRIRESRADEPWYPEAAEAIEAMPYARAAERQRLTRLQRPFYYGAWNDRTAEHAAAADRQMSPRAELGISQALRSAEGLADRLTSAPVPTLVLAAELDVLTPPLAGRLLARRLPDAQFFVLDGVGHFPWVDGPEQFAAAVEGFLAA